MDNICKIYEYLVHNVNEYSKFLNPNYLVAPVKILVLLSIKLSD
jgi:hypothetical protein